MIGAARVRRPRPVALVGAVMALAFMFAFIAPGAQAPAHASIGIFDDDGGKPLFKNKVLAPDKAYEQCLLITATPQSGDDTVSITAADVAGPLATNLQVKVEAGTGGRYNDCGTFTGSTIFTGSLGALAATSAAHGVQVSGWDLRANAARTFRITVWLADGAVQGTSTSGRFVWEMRGEGGTSPTPSPTGGSSSTTPASSSPTASSSSSTGSPSSSSSGAGGSGSSDGTGNGSGTGANTKPTTMPSVTELPSIGSGDSGATKAGKGQSDLEIGMDRISQVLSRAQQAVIAVAVEPQYPLLAIALAVAFLVLQDVIDRRDPKFAGVARRKDNEVDFPDRFGTGRKA